MFLTAVKADFVVTLPGSGGFCESSNAFGMGARDHGSGQEFKELMGMRV